MKRHAHRVGADCIFDTNKILCLITGWTVYVDRSDWFIAWYAEWLMSGCHLAVQRNHSEFIAYVFWWPMPARSARSISRRVEPFNSKRAIISSYDPNPTSLRRHFVLGGRFFSCLSTRTRLFLMIGPLFLKKIKTMVSPIKATGEGLKLVASKPKRRPTGQSSAVVVRAVAFIAG